MWYFFSPKVIFGEDAIQWLAQIEGQRAFIVTDENMLRLGYVDIVCEQLKAASIEVDSFTEIEPEAHRSTVERCAQAMAAFSPDWGHLLAAKHLLGVLDGRGIARLVFLGGEGKSRYWRRNAE